MNSNKNILVFVLGREQKLALAELEAVLDRFGICYLSSARHGRDGSSLRISGNLVFANIQNFSDDDAKKLINVLAGTVKIFSLSSSSGERSETWGSRNLNNWIPDQVRNDIKDIISNEKKEADSKFNFGISNYTKSFSKAMINKIGIETKIQLKRAGYKTRFVALTDGDELTTIQSLKNKLDNEGIEIGIFEEGIGILIALNNPEEWNERDYGKPASDKYSGMTPPKLARTMINIALASLNQKSNIKNQNENEKLKNEEINEKWKMRTEKCDNAVVVDPFCGSGNILMEAMMLGCEVVGSDISPKAVHDSETNLNWLIQKSNLKNQNENVKFKIFQADATSDGLRKILTTDNCELTTSHKNFVFVTEPFLGQPKKFKPTYNATHGEYMKVKDLYLKFLKNIKNVIPSGVEESLTKHKISPRASLGRDDSRVVLCIIFPLIETPDRGRFSLYNECVDEVKKLGYTQTCKPFIYGRDYQVVKREIVLLQLKQK